MLRLLRRWLKAMIDFMRGLARRFLPRETISRVRHIKEALVYRLIKTGLGFPSMPKFQPCPTHNGWKKRIEKLDGGAVYYCNRCREPFLVGR